MISITGNTSLSLFCRPGFSGQCPATSCAQRDGWTPHPPHPLKAGYSAHSVLTRSGLVGRRPSLAGRGRYFSPGCRRTAIQVSSCAVTRPSIPQRGCYRRATATGLHGSRVGIPCHWEAPGSLNPQHPPQTGRKKQTPGTSSICPSTDF